MEEPYLVLLGPCHFATMWCFPLFQGLVLLEEVDVTPLW